ncbi:MAG: heavy metal-responsive transcriptional regulator [Actinomycetota bacterium]
MTMTVSQLASRTGISADTVRYYEREGLLPPPERSPSGYRLYDEVSADRIGFVRRAQDLGLRLREIRELLLVSDNGTCPCGHTAELLGGRIGEIDAEITRLSELRSELNDMLARSHEPGCEDKWEWVCGPYLATQGGERP